MPSGRTTVTELGTALGMLGLGSIDEAVHSGTTVMRSLSPETWDHLARLRAGGAYDAEFHAAWENGRAFLRAADGLRGRLPNVIEWKGTGRAPGDEVAPIDLRVDHVYLVSCKYLSNILFNASPWHAFDSLLVPAQSRGGRAARDVLPGGGDWYAEVAPGPYQALYESVRRAVLEWETAPVSVAPVSSATAPHLGSRQGPSSGVLALPGLGGDGAGELDPGEGRNGAGPGRRLAMPSPVLRTLPSRAVDLSTEQRDALGQWLKPGWPAEAKAAYAALSAAVSEASVRRWRAAMDEGRGTGEAMLWRLLRIGSAPYFVLGSSATRSLRLRIATSWDWRQQFSLVSFSVVPQAGGQPRVAWAATVRERSTHEVCEVAGHVEVRWSHGRFGGLPEAKGYLDTPHHLVPGYFALL